MDISVSQMLLMGLSLHPYLGKTWLWSSGRQDSTGSGGSPSNRDLKEAETQGFRAKGCLPYTPLLCGLAFGSFFSRRVASLAVLMNLKIKLSHVEEGKLLNMPINTFTNMRSLENKYGTISL